MSNSNDEKEEQIQDIVEESAAVAEADLAVEEQINEELWTTHIGDAEEHDDSVDVELEDETLSPFQDPETARVDRTTELENNHQEQKIRVIQAERAVAGRRQRLENNREKRDRVRGTLAHLTTARDSLGSWIQERSQSLALKLLAHIDLQEKNLQSDEKMIHEWAEARISVTVDTAASLRKKYITGMWKSLFAAVIIPLLLLGLNILLKQVDLQVPWFEDIWWRYAILGVGLLVIFVLMSLATYHRGYMRIKFEMDERLAQGRYLLGAIDHVRTERARIEGLAPQVRDRLQFLGAVLQEPWRVPEYDGATEDSDKLKQGLPALLQIAKTARSNDATMIKLRAQVIAEQFRIGMRRQAIEELTRAAAERIGIPIEQAELNVIDKDSSAQGLRAALFDLVRDPDVLEQLGRTRVTQIASQIQGGITPSGDRLGIALTNLDTLQGLSLNYDLLADWSENRTSWDGYLTEILEDGAALSRLAFSAIGTAQSRHLRFQSIAVAPKRLREKAGQLIEFVEVDDGIVTGAEIVARLDITPAMDVSDVALFEETISDGWTQASAVPNSPSTMAEGERNITL